MDLVKHVGVSAPFIFRIFSDTMSNTFRNITAVLQKSDEEVSRIVIQESGNVAVAIWIRELERTDDV